METSKDLSSLDSNLAFRSAIHLVLLKLIHPGRYTLPIAYDQASAQFQSRKTYHNRGLLEKQQVVTGRDWSTTGARSGTWAFNEWEKDVK
jgi:hypothetical protein